VWEPKDAKLDADSKSEGKINKHDQSQKKYKKFIFY
jgi:hypothetical protein